MFVDFLLFRRANSTRRRGDAEISAEKNRKVEGVRETPASQTGGTEIECNQRFVGVLLSVYLRVSASPR